MNSGDLVLAAVGKVSKMKISKMKIYSLGEIKYWRGLDNREDRIKRLKANM